ncbi:MAG: SBBP repeat-containing protein [Planctomycetota bacterium]|nr:SBBP repeat-containing protein [Planctomycetota bacterium]
MSPLPRHAVYSASLILFALVISGCGKDEKTTVITQGGGSPPPAPTGLMASSPGSGQVLLDWSFVPVATSYVVYWSSSPGVTQANGNPIPVFAPPFVHECLDNGTMHYYVVSAVNSSGESTISVTEASATPYNRGILDPSFGGQGWVTHDSAALGYGADVGYGITADQAGRILVAGYSRGPADDEMAIWRYESNGYLDATFGQSGVVIHGNAAGGNNDDVGRDIAVDSSGRIYVTGHSFSSGSTWMVVWCYDDAGVLDPSFGAGGIVTEPGAGGATAIGYAVEIDQTGKIVVAGLRDNGTDIDIAIWRYMPDGTPDGTFGSGGFVSHDGAAGGPDERGFDLTIDSANRIVVAGQGTGGVVANAMIVWRFDSVGNIDSSFGSAGVAVYLIPGQSAIGDAVTIESTGRILVAGSSINSGTGDLEMTIWAYDDTGTPEVSFGTGGIVNEVSPAGLPAECRGIAVDALGRIYVAGRGARPVGPRDMILWAFDSNGNPDPSFGSGGFVSHDDARGWALILDACERVLVAGVSGGGDMALWRFH